MGLNPKVSFFKVLLGDFMERLTIPPAFARKFKEIIPKVPTLKPHEGKSSIVVMVENQDGCFFQGGWKQFVKSNCLEVGDFLVFNLIDERTYQVVIYGRSCCPKDINVSFSDNGERKNTPDNCFPTPEKYIKIEEEEQQKKNLPSEEKEIKIKLQRQAHEVEEIKIKKRVRPRKNGIKIKNEGHSGFIKPEISAAKSVWRRVERRKERITERIKSLKPKNPFFVAEIKGYQKHRLIMPSAFARKTGLVSNKTIKIKDPEGVKWPVAVRTVKVGEGFQFVLGSGWVSFYKSNRFCAGDICVFHFIAEMGDVIKVEIHRKKEKK